MSLFKYYPAERLSDFFNLRLRYTPPTEFNDPFECLPHVLNFVAETVQQARQREIHDLAYLRLKSQAPRTQVSYQEFVAAEPDRGAHVLKQITVNSASYLRQLQILWMEQLKRFGVLCLCQNGGSAAMWAHYGGNHSGFLVEFNEESLFFKDQLEDRVLVEYDVKRITLDYAASDYLPVAKTIFARKSTEWSYEREIRYVKVFEMAEGELDAAGSPSLFRFPSSAIISITAGLNATRETIEMIRGQLKFKQFKHVKLLYASRHLDAYEVERLVIKPRL